MPNNYRYDISLTRVTGMVLIILCHVMTHYNQIALGQLFNVGIEVFFLISGFLYAEKNINNYRTFYFERWKKLILPMCILLVFYTVYWIITKSDVNPIFYPLYIFNLQGIGAVFEMINNPVIPGIGNLWFLTVIMFCYFLLPLIKKADKKVDWGSRKQVYTTLFSLFVLCLVFSIINISLGYFFTFFLGYALRKTDNLYDMAYWKTTIIMIFAMAFRLLGRKYIDGSSVYDVFIVVVTHALLAFWIYETIYFLYQKLTGLMESIAKNRLFREFDKKSLYVYMVQNLFLVSPFNISAIGGGGFMQMIVFLIELLITANTLYFLHSGVLKLLDRNYR